MSKVSEPMALAKEILGSAYEKSGHCYKVLAEQIDLHYQVVLKMYEFNKVPNERYMLKIEKFLGRKNFTPRKRKAGRPSLKH